MNRWECNHRDCPTNHKNYQECFYRSYRRTEHVHDNDYKYM